MEPQKGYYSLVQFCPDRGRAEAVNIGLVLFVPGSNDVGVRMVHDSRRAARIFGKEAVDAWWLKKLRDHFERRLEVEHQAGRFSSVEDLEKYLASFGNDVISTPARSTRVENATADLERLFARLVEAPRAEAPSEMVAAVRPLHDVFTELKSRMTPVGIGRSFPIEGLDYRVRSDYDYRNGTANLIRVLRVGTARPTNAIKHAIDLGGESVQVERHLRIEDRRAKLIVVVAPEAPDDRTRRIEEEIGKIKDYPATFIPSERIPELAERVRQEAK